MCVTYLLYINSYRETLGLKLFSQVIHFYIIKLVTIGDSSSFILKRLYFYQK